MLKVGCVFNYLGVRNELANCCFSFEGFKGKNNWDAKKKDAKYDWNFSRLKCNKQCARIVDRGWNVSTKMQLRYIYRERGFKAFRKGKQDQEMYEKEFCSNQISKRSKAGVFKDKIERS